jgi:hypothetical protein
MVYFSQTIQRLLNRSGHLLPPLQPEDKTKALADFGKNGFDVLFVNMKGMPHGLPLMQRQRTPSQVVPITV